MPKAFEACVSAGGAVRTVSGRRYGCGNGQYRHICVYKGKTYLGYIKNKKEKYERKKSRKPTSK